MRFKDSEIHVRFKDLEIHMRFKDSEIHVRFKDSEIHMRFKDSEIHVRFKDNIYCWLFQPQLRNEKMDKYLILKLKKEIKWCFSRGKGSSFTQ